MEIMETELTHCLVCDTELWFLSFSPQIIPYCPGCGTLHEYTPNTKILRTKKRPDIIKVLQALNLTKEEDLNIDPLRRTQP